MKNIKIGIALFSCLILGAMMFANSGLEAKNSNSNNSKAEYVQDEIIVKFKGDSKKPFRVIKVPQGSVEETAQAYRGKANVVYAEPNYILYADAAPDDPLYADWQWALNNTGQYQEDYFDQGTPGADINWKPAWSEFATSTWAIGNTTTIIAILDSGIDASHPDLNDKLIKGRNFTGKPTDTNDVHGHGTHVAGIAAAETNNSVGNTGGIAGVAFPDNIEIMPVKVLNRFASSVSTSVADGIYYATNNGAKVINLSLGGASYSTTLKNAVDYAWGKGVLIAASAGNDGKEIKRYPASYPNVMSVAATDNKDARADFSNYNDQIDVSAPGVDVLSTLIYKKGIREYGLGTGTSMACPHVAGLAGLLFAQDSNRTNTQVRTIIEESADDLSGIGWDKYFGHGKINVYAALTYPTCETNGDCDDGNDCTTDICIKPGAWNASCENTWFTCGADDECCGPGCTSDTDPDCSQSECIKDGKNCNCNGKCQSTEDKDSCLDCQPQQ